MWRYLLIYLGVYCVTAIARDPQQVASEAVAAIDAGDAKRFVALAHPELLKRLRSARVFSFSRVGRAELLRSGSDVQVANEFFTAIESVAPNRLRPIMRYRSSEAAGDLVIVTFEAEFPSGYPPGRNRFPERVVLKRNGNDWRFLWSVRVQLHTDLEWNPIEPQLPKPPNQSPQPTTGLPPGCSRAQRWARV